MTFTLIKNDIDGIKNSFKYFIRYNDNDVIKTIMYKASINDWLCQKI